jgi:tRNA(Ser,Leu) C12 N-acetylase TAN1
MELLDRYIKEIESDLVLDEMNLRDMQLRLPVRKHFWVGRLIKHKVELNKYQKQKEDLKKALVNKVITDAPVQLSKVTAEKRLDEFTEVIELNKKIKELEYVIELLEKVEKNFNSMTYDIKNVIEILKLEQQ